MATSRCMEYHLKDAFIYQSIFNSLIKFLNNRNIDVEDYNTSVGVYIDNESLPKEKNI